jgi:aldose 1-epimerase
MDITVNKFGTCPDGEASIYTLINDLGMCIRLTNYGGIIQSILVPDKNGILADVVLGFDSLEEYLGEHPYFGALIGRYSNRITKGKFSINGSEYQLQKNNLSNTLHGGIKGFDKKLWAAEIIQEEHYIGVRLTGVSPDGEEGFPGNLSLGVSYLLNNDNELIIKYKAYTDKTTIVNLTNHSYFNLIGAGTESILEHDLYIKSNKIVETNTELVPTGKLLDIENTAFDFSTYKKIGFDISQNNNTQITNGGGYDHNFVLNNKSLELVAKVKENKSGRLLEVLTDQPGMQLFTINFKNRMIGKGQKSYFGRAAFCLETQDFPDAPNHPNFPSTLLEPGAIYSRETRYRFSTI